MIENFHLWTQAWESGFLPSKNLLELGAAWASLHELPVKFFEEKMLEKIGKVMGKLLKIDQSTIKWEGRRHDNVCLLVEEGKHSPKGIWLGKFYQPITFAGPVVL